MVYIVLIAGLVIIYAALKKDSSSKSALNFKDMLNEKTEIHNIDSLIMQIKELNERVDELESAFLLYQTEFNSSIQNSSEIALQNTVPESKTAEEKFIEPDQKSEDNNSINNQIYSLFDNGKTIEEIASYLNTGKGEISLRLGLRKQKI